MHLPCYWQWLSSQHYQNSLRMHSAIASWIHRYFDNVMIKFVINSGTDAWRTDLNLLTRLFTHHTVPARTPETTVFILSMSLVNTEAAKPYMVLLALSISSSMSLNFIICITGPKIYYRKNKSEVKDKKERNNLYVTTLKFPDSNSPLAGKQFLFSETVVFCQVSWQLKVSTRQHAEVTQLGHSRI